MMKICTLYVLVMFLAQIILLQLAQDQYSTDRFPVEYSTINPKIGLYGTPD